MADLPQHRIDDSSLTFRRDVTDHLERMEQHLHHQDVVNEEILKCLRGDINKPGRGLVSRVENIEMWIGIVKWAVMIIGGSVILAVGSWASALWKKTS